jgi:hypothetical protein
MLVVLLIDELDNIVLTIRCSMNLQLEIDKGGRARTKHYRTTEMISIDPFLAFHLYICVCDTCILSKYVSYSDIQELAISSLIFLV